MTLNFTLWLFGILFLAALWNGFTAYTSMGDIDVQEKFEKIGLLDDDMNGAYPLPLKKPLLFGQVASR